MIVFFNGNFIKKNKVSISPDDRGFLFGDGVYEVIKGCNGKLFRGYDHIKRLEWNLQEVKIDIDDSINFYEISEKLLELNRQVFGNSKIYIQVTRGVAPRQHSFPTKKITPTIYIESSITSPPVEKWKAGGRVILRNDERRERCDIKSISLLPSIMANQEAVENFADEVVFVKNGYLTEGSHTTLCIVFNGKVTTYPASNSVLPGITRKIIKEICYNLNIEFVERETIVEELFLADEMFLLGTTTEVLPIIKYENQLVNDGKPGNITRKLHKALNQMIYNAK